MWVAALNDPGGMPRLPGEPGYVSPHIPDHERGVRWSDGWYWRRGGDDDWWRSRAAGGPWEHAEPSAVRKRIEIDPEDAGLLLAHCEPGSTLEEPAITEENLRLFVVAQAEAERQRRLRTPRP